MTPKKKSQENLITITLLKILSGVLNTKVIMAAIGLIVLWIGYKQQTNTSHHAEEDKKTQVKDWNDSLFKERSKTRWTKVDSNFTIQAANADTIKQLLRLAHPEIKYSLK